MIEPHLHPDERRLADYHAGRLSAPDTLAVSDHLAGCPPCRASFTAKGDGPRGIVPGLHVTPTLPDALPDYEEMAALLDGTLAIDQRAGVRSRLEASPVAAAELADLQQFRDGSARLAPKLHGPVRRESRDDPTSVPYPGKVVAFPRFFGSSLAAVAAVLLCVAGWWLVSHHRSTNPSLWADADLSTLPDDLRRSVEQAARTGVVESPPFASVLRPPPGTLAGLAPAQVVFRQLDPVGIVVRNDHPTLRWTAREGVATYVVYLGDLEGRTPMLRQEISGTLTTWTPTTPLLRGATYEWQVEARNGTAIIDRAPRPPAPETRFQVLDEQHTAELTRIENGFRENPLILGVAYTQAGLETAANGQFIELARHHPRSEVVQRLLRQSRLQMNAKD